MRGKAWVFWAFSCAILALGGCASRQDMTLSELLRDLELEAGSWQGSLEDAPTTPKATPKATSPAATQVVADRPDSPASALPLPPAGLPEAKRPAGGTITIQPDSLLQISVDEDPSLDGSYPVNDIGAIQLGYVGPVILLDKTEVQAAQKIQEVLKYRDFRKATVNVRIIRASYDKIQIEGAVTRPGLVRIGSGDSISLNDAILRAGGLKTSIRNARVKVVRDGLLSAIAPALPGEEYVLVSENGVPVVPDIRLQNNDVAFILATVAGPDSDKESGGVRHVLVLGEVTRKGYYSFAQDEPCTLMHLLFKMGGLPKFANEGKVKIIRRDESGQERDFVVNAERIMEDGSPERDFPLEDGDRVVVSPRRISLF